MHQIIGAVKHCRRSRCGVTESDPNVLPMTIWPSDVTCPVCLDGQPAGWGPLLDALYADRR